MNDFKERYIVTENSNNVIERKKGGEIIITSALKAQIIDLLQGKIEKKDIKGIGDEETIERIMLKIVAENLELDALLYKYKEKGRTNYEGYNFRPEAIEMLRQDCSQTDMAAKLNIPRKSFSVFMKRVREENADNELGQLLREHSERKIKKIDLDEDEKNEINKILDRYEIEHPVGEARFESKDPIKSRYDNLRKLLSTVERMLEEGYTLKELSAKKIISESYYWKYKEEAKYLAIILSRRSKTVNIEEVNNSTNNSGR